MDVYTDQEHRELSWMSLAYIDAGSFLAKSIIDDEFPDSAHRSMVPVFLIHQGLELLYKSALKYKTGTYPGTHNLRKLHDEFSKYFPSLDFPVPEQILGVSPDLGDPSNVVQHEMLRYPTNRKGEKWSQTEQINLEEIKEEIKGLNKASLKVWLKVREDRDEI